MQENIEQFLVFIDDDELPAHTWRCSLAQAKYQADNLAECSDEFYTVLNAAVEVVHTAYNSRVLTSQ